MAQKSLYKFLGEKTGKKILDLGCGTGAITHRFVKQNLVIGVDYSIPLLKFARKKGLIIYQVDVQKLPFIDACFDVVFASGVIQHFRDPMKILWEWARVVRPGGELLVFTNTPDSIIRYISRMFLNIKGKDEIRFGSLVTCDIVELVWEFKKMDFLNIRLMALFYPFRNRAVFLKIPNFVMNYLSTDFAILGTKKSPTFDRA